MIDDRMKWSLTGSSIALALSMAWSAASGQMHDMNPPATDSHESVETKIARALSAGPENVTKDATVADMDSKGNMIVLRKGTNDFTCMPGDPKKVGSPAMCEGIVAMKWNQEAAEHKAKPSNTVPGIEYMLAGATQRSDSDPFDTVDPPIVIGPHWMILWPFDPKTSGLATHHKATGA
jgi:hypothetical protein